MSEKSQWTVETLKEHFEDILSDRDTAIKASFDASLTAINKAEARLNEILLGFPQEHSRKIEFEELEKQMNVIKVDHVQRREFGELKDEQSSGRGARTAITAGMGIVVALIAVALGTMYANQLTNEDVSVQIEREAPWLQDKIEIENELKIIEKQILVLSTTQAQNKASINAKLAQHEALDKIREVLERHENTK